MNAQELFDKYAHYPEFLIDEPVINKENFTAALAEAIEGGHLQPQVMQGDSQPVQNAGVCKWKVESEDDGRYETGCGTLFQFLVDGPIENGFKFCSYCCKEIGV